MTKAPPLAAAERCSGGVMVSEVCQCSSASWVDSAMSGSMLFKLLKRKAGAIEVRWRFQNSPSESKRPLPGNYCEWVIMDQVSTPAHSQHTASPGYQIYPHQRNTATTR